MMAFSIALRYVTRVMNIGLSVCGILFYLQVFTCINKQLESYTHTGSCVSSCCVYWLSFVDIPTAHKTLKCQHEGGSRDGHDVSSSFLIVYACLCESKE